MFSLGSVPERPTAWPLWVPEARFRKSLTSCCPMSANIAAEREREGFTVALEVMMFMGD